MSESEQTRRLCAELRELGCIVRSIVGTRMQEPGWPDRYLCHRLWHGHLEFKLWHEQLAPLQRKRAHDLNVRQPMTCLVVRHGAPLSCLELPAKQRADDEALAMFVGAAQLLLALDAAWRREDERRNLGPEYHVCREALRSRA